MCQGSKWGRISPGIQWTWSQTRDTCPSRVDTCPLLTLLPDLLQRYARGQNGVEFCQEFNGHGPRHVTCLCHVSFTNSDVLQRSLVLNFTKFRTDMRLGEAVLNF